MMAHWAELDENNVVLRITVGSNDEPDEGYQWIMDNLGGRWVKTSYNTRNGKKVDPETGKLTDEPGFRGNFAGIGFTYYEDIDAFMPPKPEEYPSWVINKDTYLWEPPIPKPEGKWFWDENSLSWQQIIEETD